MGVAFGQVAMKWYLRDGTDQFQNPSIAEQSQFLTSLKAFIGSGAGPSGMRSGKEDAYNLFILKADEEYWDLDEVTTAAEAYGNGFCVEFRELQTKCRAVSTDMLAGLIDRIDLAKRNIKLE